MVRGRRVPAVVACPPADNCCSPVRKRRLIAPGSPRIAAYFESDIKTHKNELYSTLFPDELANKVDDGGVLVATPVKMDKTRIPSNEPSTPTTPHRIEMCAEEGKIAPKARKRLIPAKVPQTKLTEFFPVRRSVRKTKTEVLEEKQRSLLQLLRKNIEDGLEVRIFEDKGRGVVASRSFDKGDFVVEYSGDLIDLNEAKRREERYAQDLNTGCYMYYFKHQNQQYCVDATAETGKLGRLVNHSRNGNLITRTIMVDGNPRLVLLAKDAIREGTELTYDYGDRSKEALRHHPWLAY